MTADTGLVGAIRELLSQRLFIEVDSPDVDLIDSGLVDSIGVVELILEIERRFEIELPPEQVEIDDFRSIHRIAMLVGRRLPSPAALSA
jgi:methoxymalonate biosynthesis acyl carrier protein